MVDGRASSGLGDSGPGTTWTGEVLDVGTLTLDAEGSENLRSGQEAGGEASQNSALSGPRTQDSCIPISNLFAVACCTPAPSPRLRIAFARVHPTASAPRASHLCSLAGPSPGPRRAKTAGLSLWPRWLSSLEPGCGVAGLTGLLQSSSALCRLQKPRRPLSQLPTPKGNARHSAVQPHPPPTDPNPPLQTLA